MGSGISLSLKGVGKSFGEKEVLKSINLDIPAGQFVAVVGKSGCGKSTLLRLVSGLETPTVGTISFDDVAQHGLNPATKIMFQSPRLLPWKTVLENVLIGLGKEHVKQAESALDSVGLLQKKDQLPRSLSGGEAQRVSLARALASSPKLLLLDEPLGALDALTRYGMQQLIHDIWQREGFTVLLITHDVDEAVVLSDRVIMIRDHGIHLDDTIDLSYPRNRGDVRFIQQSTTILHSILEQD